MSFSLNLLTNAGFSGDYIRRLAPSGRQGDIFLTDEPIILFKTGV